MIRAFLAVELPEPLKTSLATLQLDLKQRLSRDFSREVRVSWVQSAAIHLTIKFFGDIEEQLVLPMKESIRDVVREHRAIDVPLDRLGVFPRLQQPRVLWVGPAEQWEQGEGASRLIRLHRAIDECCSHLGLAGDDRPQCASHVGTNQRRRTVGRAGIGKKRCDGSTVATRILARRVGGIDEKRVASDRAGLYKTMGIAIRRIAADREGTVRVLLVSIR